MPPQAAGRRPEVAPTLPTQAQLARPRPFPSAGQIAAAVVFGVLILGGFLSCGAFIVFRRWQNKRTSDGWGRAERNDKAAKYYNADTWRDDL